MRLARLARIPLLALGAFLLATGAASAYPQWQFTSGTTRCSQCHFSPAGGGLITSYGRDANGDDLSTWEGNGAFLHGAVDLPRWLKLGFDWRGAFVSNDVGGPDSPATAIFPMQLDGHIRTEIEDFSINAIVGARGQAREPEVTVPDGSPRPANASRFVSREHFIAWQPSTRGPYVRAGRFFAPFGLRLAEHIVYVRRDLGFNLYQETYNLSGGYLENGWELHVTLFGPDFLQAGTQAKGAAAYYERRLLDETAAVALQGRFALGDGAQRVTVGGVVKYFLEPAKLLFLGEGNLVMATPDGGSASNQFVGLFGASWLPVRGIMLTVFGERLHTDISVRDAATNAATGLLSWFPYPHFELQLVGRQQMPSGGDPARTLLFQLHYFL